MDVATLFDTTIPHEMTHSKVIGILQQDTGAMEEYGWSACIALQSPFNSDTS